MLCTYVTSWGRPLRYSVVPELPSSPLVWKAVGVVMILTKLESVI